MDKLTKKQTTFFELIYKARKITFHIDNIKTSSNTKKTNEKIKILRFFHKNLNDNETVNIGYILYNKHYVCQMFFKYILNYYIKSFKKM